MPRKLAPRLAKSPAKMKAKSPAEGFYQHKQVKNTAYFFENNMGKPTIQEEYSWQFKIGTFHPTNKEFDEYKRVSEDDLQKLLTPDPDDKVGKRRAKWIKRVQARVKSGEIYQESEDMRGCPY